VAKVTISAKSERIARAICDALSPDLATLPMGDESSIISLKGPNIVIDINSKDVASLRASINSFLLLAGASMRCLKV
jgi:KEOPS complex subunit Pcc1